MTAGTWIYRPSIQLLSAVKRHSWEKASAASHIFGMLIWPSDLVNTYSIFVSAPVYLFQVYALGLVSSFGMDMISNITGPPVAKAPGTFISKAHPLCLFTCSPQSNLSFPLILSRLKGQAYAQKFLVQNMVFPSDKSSDEWKDAQMLQIKCILDFHSRTPADSVKEDILRRTADHRHSLYASDEASIRRALVSYRDVLP